MITHLAHIGMVVPDIIAARADYARLLGCPEPRIEKRDNGFAICTFALSNTAIELITGLSNSARSHLHAIMGGSPTLTTLAWAYEGEAPDGHISLKGNTKRIPDDMAAGIKTFMVSDKLSNARGAITKLDHFVLRTPNPARTQAFYGDKLGLKLTRQRNVAALDVSIQYYRCGPLIMEAATRLSADADPTAADRLWGLGWHVDNIEKQAKRLRDVGIQHKGVRDGLLPGTRVLTLLTGTQGIPTLLIEKTKPKSD